jgi:hypothetical protein
MNAQGSHPMVEKRQLNYISSVSHFDGSISGLFEEVVAFVGRDSCEEASIASPSVLEGSLQRGAHAVFDLGESLLDRVEVW